MNAIFHLGFDKLDFYFVIPIACQSMYEEKTFRGIENWLSDNYRRKLGILLHKQQQQLQTFIVKTADFLQ
jgi:hypothetical protein